MVTKEKNMRVRKLCLYLTMFIPILLFSNVIVSNFQEVISGIIFMMNLIAIPCCAIYYQVTRKNNVILYSLFYSSLLMDNLYLYYMVTNYPEYAKAPLLLILRNILIVLMIYDCTSIINWISKNRTVVFVIFIILNMCMLLTNSMTIKILYKNTVLDYTIGIGMVFMVIAITKKLITDHKKKEFMEIVFLLSVLLMIIRRAMFYFTVTSNVILLVDEEIMSCLGFYILLVGLFVECSCLIKENNRLEREVETISADIKEFQEIDKLRTQFFANLSHEIKTPINIIFSGVQLVESKAELGEEIVAEYCNKYLPMIKQNCFRILRLTNNLVDMTKLDSGFMKMNFSNVDIVKLVEDITMSVVEYVKNKDINIVFDTLIEEKIIKCDKDGIERIILNLIANSLKFTRENGNILIFMEVEDGDVVIKVKDDGIGILKENRESVFGVFVQGDKSLNRSREGSGIGLALVKGIVEEHNGSVKFEDVEIGTEVVIRIPDTVMEESLEKSKIIGCEKDIISKINTEFSDIYN